MTPTVRRLPASPTLLTVDAGLIVGFGVLAIWPLADVYGGERWLIAALVGLLCGIGVALAARRVGAGVGLTVSATVLVYLLIGPAVAVPDFAGAGFAPTWATLQVLLTGAVEVWSSSLVLAAPLGASGIVLIIPWILGLVGGAGAGFVAWCTRRGSAAPGVLAVVFVVASAYGDTLSRFTLIRGLLLVAGLVVWSRWRAQRHVRDRWVHRVAWTAAVVMVAGLGGVAAAGLTEGEDRSVLRELVTPHFDPRDHPSPLTRFRTLASSEDPAVLFGVIGPEPGDRLRLATMVAFDGQSWNVSGGAQAPEGSGDFVRLPSVERAPFGEGMVVTVVDYRGVWVPGRGEPLGLEVVDEVENVDHQAASRTLVNGVTGTVVQVEGVRWGQSYHLRYAADPEPSAEEIAAAAAGDAPFPEPVGVPEALVDRTEAWIEAAGRPTGGALAQTLAEGFSSEGFYSDGGIGETPSAAGHGTRRLTEFAQAPFLVGNDEQYAAAMALVAQQVDLPARVVVGFEISDENGNVRPDDARAWTEVHLAGLGWVAFDPTPPVERRLDPAQGDLSQLPPPAERPERAEPTPDAEREESPIARVAETSVRWLLPLALVAVGVVLVVFVVKLVRRRRRRRSGALRERCSGGWREVLDRGRDLGVPVTASQTRDEAGSLLAGAFPGAALSGLAETADAWVFGVADPSAADVEAYWGEVATALRQMRRGAAWWRRPLVWFSPASLYRPR